MIKPGFFGLAVLLAARDLIELSVFDQFSAGLMIGERNAVFYALIMQI